MYTYTSKCVCVCVYIVSCWCDCCCCIDDGNKAHERTKTAIKTRINSTQQRATHKNKNETSITKKEYKTHEERQKEWKKTTTAAAQSLTVRSIAYWWCYIILYHRALYKFVCNAKMLVLLWLFCTLSLSNRQKEERKKELMEKEREGYVCKYWGV